MSMLTTFTPAFASDTTNTKDISNVNMQANYSVNQLSSNNEDVDSQITSATITDIISGGGFQPWDRGLGKTWAVKNYITVIGTAHNKSGKPVANQTINAQVIAHIGNKICAGTGNTDKNGNFSIHITLPPAAGTYTFNTDISTQYFDIIPFTMSSNNSTVNTNVSFLYHHAYTKINRLP
ncbi:hypothetical protein CLOBY_04740 [Clostridium saccharobutylicum]|nr:hypothetical protein [Clostridium saccharobutylicum]AQS08383.1 hypothetical protein CLOBY_04740 [Clostridium saccharobutylicum]